MSPDFRIICKDKQYHISEVHYDNHENPVKELGIECGILAYWLSVNELKASYEKVKEAFEKPVIYDL